MAFVHQPAIAYDHIVPIHDRLGAFAGKVSEIYGLWYSKPSLFSSAYNRPRQGVVGAALCSRRQAQHLVFAEAFLRKLRACPESIEGTRHNVLNGMTPLRERAGLVE